MTKATGNIPKVECRSLRFQSSVSLVLGIKRPCLASGVNSRLELILTNSCQIIKNWQELASNDESEISSKPS